MAEIYLKNLTEKVLINSVREAYYQPFQATDWTDLRVGFFLSLTDETADDTITALGPDEVGNDSHTPWTDRFSIGLTDSVTGGVFLGYTNVSGSRLGTLGKSELVSSDGGIGTTNTNFWRPQNNLGANGNKACLKIIDTSIIRAGGNGPDNSQIHFPQSTVGAGGYATLVALRFQRDDARGRAKVITMTVKAGTHSGDILYTNTPSEENLITNLEAFPSTVNTLGPVELSQAPDTLWAYWPFTLSRLRIHAYGILKAA